MRNRVLTEAASARSNGASVKRTGSQLLPYLTVVLLGELALLLYWVPSDPALLARIERLKVPYRQARRAQRLKRLMEQDPVLGTRVRSAPSVALAAVLQKSATAGQTVVLFTGPCASCVAEVLRQWQALAVKERRSVVVVSRDTPERIARFVRSTRYSLPILADPDGTIARSFNVIWSPRAYAVRKDGTITWIQTRDVMAPREIALAVWPATKGNGL